MTERKQIDAVIDDIASMEAEWAAQDEIISQSLSHGPRDDYSRDYLARIDRGDVRAERCARCGGGFHGLPRGRCPGALSTDEAVEWIARREGVTVSGTADNPQYHLPNGANVILGGQEPHWVRQVYGDEPYGPPSAPYTLSDLEQMRGGFDSPHVNQIESITISGSPFLPISNEPQQFPRESFRAPIVRFWGRDPVTGQMSMLEGVLVINQVNYDRNGMTVDALLREPVRQIQFDSPLAIDPPIDQSGAMSPDGTLLPALIEDTGIEVEARTWLPGDDPAQPTGTILDGLVAIGAVDEERGLPPGNPEHRCTQDRYGRCVWESCPTNTPEPVGEIQDGMISMETMVIDGDTVGFEPMGFISEDALAVNTEREIAQARTWGGDVVRTFQESVNTTVEFDATHVNPELWNRLMR